MYTNVLKSFIYFIIKDLGNNYLTCYFHTYIKKTINYITECMLKDINCYIDVKYFIFLSNLNSISLFLLIYTY